MTSVAAARTRPTANLRRAGLAQHVERVVTQARRAGRSRARDTGKRVGSTRTGRDMEHQLSLAVAPAQPDPDLGNPRRDRGSATGSIHMRSV